MIRERKWVRESYLIGWTVLVALLLAFVPRTLASTSQAAGTGDAEVVRVLRRATQAHGGEAAVYQVRKVALSLVGWSNVGGRGPEDAPRRVAHTNIVTIDSPGERYGFRVSANLAESSSSLTGSNSEYKFLILPDDAYLEFPAVDMATHGFGMRGIIDSAKSYVPPMVLATLNHEMEEGRATGREQVIGQMVDVLTFPPAFTGYTQYLFSVESGLLVGMRQQAGGTREVPVYRLRMFSGFDTIGGIPFPQRTTTYRGGAVTSDYLYEATDLAAEFGANAFRPSSGLAVFDNPENPPYRAVRLADHVYALQMGFNALVVEFPDYVIVVDTPPGRYEKARELIRAEIGDKPIRFAAPTHHDSWFEAGVADFAGAGATIISTSRNRDHFARLIDAGRADGPGREADFRIVDDRIVFEDGDLRLEIVNIGPVGHAQDMYVAYLPTQRILYACHLFGFSPDALPITIAPIYKELALKNLAALARAGIEPGTIVQGHGWRTFTWEDVEQAVAALQ